MYTLNVTSSTSDCSDLSCHLPRNRLVSDHLIQREGRVSTCNLIFYYCLQFLYFIIISSSIFRPWPRFHSQFCTKQFLFAMAAWSCVSRDGIRKGEFPPCCPSKGGCQIWFTLGTQCMSSELRCSLCEGNRQRPEVAIYLRQSKMLSPRCVLYPPKKVGVTTVHPFHLFCF